jgi:hypothetical protein
MFNELVWIDFESASALDLKAAGTVRYADDASTRAIVLAYALVTYPRSLGMPTARSSIGAARRVI